VAAIDFVDKIFIFEYSSKTAKASMKLLDGDHLQDISSWEDWPHWTHLSAYTVSNTNHFLLSYQSSTGLLNVHSVELDGSLKATPNFTNLVYRDGISHIVSVCDELFIFGDSKNGKLFVVEMTPTGPRKAMMMSCKQGFDVLQPFNLSFYL